MHPDPIKKRVQDQFGATAQSYVTSASHAHGDDLQRMIELAQPRGDEHMLDIATGGGHTALAFAPHVREVVATDLTPEMLAAAEAFVRGQGATNVRFEPADAEGLPFPDASFDLVTTRIAPHHFPNPQQYIREVARVLRPGGRFVLDDNMAPEDAELGAFMNRFEQWRDPSHVHAYSAAEWRAWIEAAGMVVEHADPLQTKRYEFPTWAARMRMPADEQAALEAWLIAAPARCREFFHVEVAGGRVQALAGAFAIIVAKKR
jgi:ubiquinone/menaquinone biosynthesis C-methylase UbiE